MSDPILVLNLTFFFLLRVGLPLLLLVVLGVAIDKWQKHLHRET